MLYKNKRVTILRIQKRDIQVALFAKEYVTVNNSPAVLRTCRLAHTARAVSASPTFPQRLYGNRKPFLTLFSTVR